VAVGLLCEYTSPTVGTVAAMMKILSPVDNLEEIDPLIKAGANEFYCGLLTVEWHNQYIAGSINRRPGGRANFTTFAELGRCVNIAHSHDIPVFLTLNEHYYIPQQYPFIWYYIDRVLAIGVDGLLVADLALLIQLHQKKINTKIMISTGGNTFNSETVRFYQELGASRIIFPRHLTIAEITGIITGTANIEYEVFILNSRCPNVDGLCTFHHGLADPSIEPLFDNACILPYDITVGTAGDGEVNPAAWQRQHIWQTVHVDDHPCGACAVYEFSQIGITSLKIVGRGNSTARKLADITFIKSLLDFLDTKPVKQEFRKMAQHLYRNIYHRPCRVHMCYYPEVLVGEWNRPYSSPQLPA